MTDKNFDENQFPESAEGRSEGSDAQASGPEPQNQDSREAMASEGSDETPVDGAPDDLTVDDILGATQTGEAVIGLGATAISQFAGLIVQNEKHLGQWETAVNAGLLAGTRGVTVNADDAQRSDVIARLLCDGMVDVPEPLADALPHLAKHAARGLVQLHGRQVALTPDGWPYARLIASALAAAI